MLDGHMGEKQRGMENAESWRNIELQTVQSTGNERPPNQISDQTEGFYMCAGDKELPPAWLINTAMTGTRLETLSIPLCNLLPSCFKGPHILQAVCCCFFLVFLLTTVCFSPVSHKLHRNEESPSCVPPAC